MPTPSRRTGGTWRSKYNLADLNEKAFQTDWEAVVRRKFPHAAPEERRALAEDPKSEYQLKRSDAVERYEAECDDRRATHSATMRMSVLLVLAAAPVLGIAGAVGAWFLVNRSHGSPRPRPDEWGP